MTDHSDYATALRAWANSIDRTGPEYPATGDQAARILRGAADHIDDLKAARREAGESMSEAPDKTSTDPRDRLWDAWDHWAEQIPQTDGSTSPTLSIPGQLAFELWGLIDRLRAEKGDTETIRRHPIPVGDLPANHPERLLDDAVGALIWMSGSPSFGSEAQAGEHFREVVLPLIERLLERRTSRP